MKILIFILTVSCNFVISFPLAQTIHDPVDAAYLGQSALSIEHSDPFSLKSNIASVASIDNTALGVYGEDRFLLNQVNLFAGSLIIPTVVGNCALQTEFLGYKNFNESQIGIVYGRKLGKNFNLAIKFNYHTINIPLYLKRSTITPEIGLLCHIVKNVTTGLDVIPLSENFSHANQSRAYIIKFGISYRLSEHVEMSSEFIKEKTFPARVNVGLQYYLLDQFFIRIGLQPDISSFYAGAGLGWNNYRLDIITSYHPQLGITPGVMLIIHFKKP